jgi:hypothetical protein
LVDCGRDSLEDLGDVLAPSRRQLRGGDDFELSPHAIDLRAPRFTFRRQPGKIGAAVRRVGVA